MTEFLKSRMPTHGHANLEELRHLFIEPVKRFFKKLSCPGGIVVDDFLSTKDDDVRGEESAASGFHTVSGVAPALGGEAADATAAERKQTSATSGYWVSISARTGFRRLHRCGGCWYRAEHTEMLADPSTARYNARCGRCWKGDGAYSQAELVTNVRNDVDSTVDTDSESSSSEV